MEKEELVMLGRIDGKLDELSKHLTRQDVRLDTIDVRLRKVEEKAAVTGAISGGAISIGIALVIEGLKQWVSRGGAGN